MLKAVATDYLGYNADWEREQLAPFGVRFEDYDFAKFDLEGVAAAAAEADALVVAAVEVGRDLLSRLRKLRLIIRLGVGIDNVDVEEASRRGVYLANMPTYCTREVAEHAAALLLSCARGLSVYNGAVRDGKWHYSDGGELNCLQGRTLGVVGCGRIGSALLDLLRGFGLNYLIYDPYIPDSRISQVGGVRAAFGELLSRSDYISIHAPLTGETFHMFDDKAFRSVRSGVVLINTARGPIVDQSALLAALENGTIAAAGLDVFEQEPLDLSNPLLKFPNVVVTPHSAWYSRQARQRMREWVVEDLKRLASGREPQSVANPEVRDVLGQKALIRNAEGEG